MRHSKRAYLAGGIALLVALGACGLGGPPPKPTLTPETSHPTSTVDAAALTAAAPTQPPTPTENLAPTPLPAPTQIVPPTAAPTDASQTTPGAPPAGPGITLNPAVGEPGDITIVNGSGWPATVKVDLHWGPPKGALGPVYWTVTSDANGAFNVGLKVPTADKWPGGAPNEHDLLQLRATSDATAPYFYWANYTYIKRLVPPTKGSPVGPSATPTLTLTPTP